MITLWEDFISNKRGPRKLFPSQLEMSEQARAERRI